MQKLNDTLRAYLAERWPDADSIKIVNLTDIPGGYSKQTFSFDAVVDRQGALTTHHLILRQDNPADIAMLHNSREDEHVLLNRLREHTSIPVPKSYFVEMDRSIFGEPIMIIERLAGSAQPSSLFRNPELLPEAQSLAKQLCEQLAALHLTRPEILNSDGRFNDPLRVGIQTDTWDHYIDGTLNHALANYHNIAYDVFPIYYDTVLQLRRQKPRSLPLVFLHGEMNPGNIIYKEGKLVGLVDWELARIGDPREDLSWFRSTDFILGTKFFDSVDFPGGFLGYYNHLTGFNVQPQELHYFTLLTTVAFQSQVIAGIRRRFEGKHQEIKHVYLSQLVLPPFWVNLGMMLGYPSPSQA